MRVMLVLALVLAACGGDDDGGDIVLYDCRPVCKTAGGQTMQSSMEIVVGGRSKDEAIDQCIDDAEMVSACTAGSTVESCTCGVL